MQNSSECSGDHVESCKGEEQKGSKEKGEFSEGLGAPESEASGGSTRRKKEGYFLNRRTFRLSVEAALLGLPKEFEKRLENVEVLIEDEPPPELCRNLETENLFGLYQGVPLSERGQSYSFVLPDRIIIYRKPILQSFRSRAEIIREIRKTVIHEIGHHFGLSEEEIRRATGE